MIWKVCVNQGFHHQDCVLFFFFLTLNYSQVQRQDFLSKVKLNILASEFLSSPLRNPHGSSRWDVKPNSTQKGKASSYPNPHAPLNLPSTLSWKSSENSENCYQRISLKRWQFMCQMSVPLESGWTQIRDSFTASNISFLKTPKPIQIGEKFSLNQVYT